MAPPVPYSAQDDYQPSYIPALIAGTLVFALYLLGSGGDEPQTAAPPPPTTTTTERPAATPPPARPTRPARVRLRIEAAGAVNVCLKAGDKTLINGQTLEAGQRTPTFASKRFRLTLGNNSARLRINGKTRRVKASSQPIGLEITPGQGRQPLSARERPVCTA